MSDQPPFGEWLRRQRRARDLSRQALAKQVGCAEITLRRVETGTLKPSPQLAALLLQAVGVPPGEIEPWVRFARGLAAQPSAEPAAPVVPAKTNLPAALTSFVGRERELADLSRLLEKHRLITLTGAGGAGKTRLALRAGERHAANFPDGVWLVELAPLEAAGLIAPTLAAELGVSLSGPLPAAGVLANYLRPKAALLILDNCEHLLDGCARLADDLLRQCPRLKILTTSREALSLLGEALYRVPTLDLPDPAAPLEGYGNVTAIQLFEARAQLAQFDFALKSESAAAVGEICRRLDGIPLAIELAAVQAGQFTPGEIARQLAESFAGLTGGSRTALPRQQTMRGSIDWSWNLLTEAERTALAGVSVFSGGWTKAAAEAVCGAEAAALADSLVRKSLVIRPAEAGPEPRYALHEVIRQYAHERLTEAGGAGRLAQRHAAYFAALAAAADAQLHGPEQNRWLERLRRDLPNLRAALEFSLAQDPAAALHMTAALAWFWYRHGLLVEGRQWLDRAIAANRPALARRRALPPDQAASYRQALLGAGQLAHFQGDYAAARGLLEQSLEIALVQEDQGGVAHAQLVLGMGSTWQGDFAGAEQRLSESIELFHNGGEAWERATALNALGFLRLSRGDYERARPMLEESLQAAREAGDRYGQGMPLSNLGTLEYQLGRLEQGQALLEESLAVGRETHDPTVTTWAMKELGHIAQHQGDHARAAELYQAVLAGCRLSNFGSGIAEMLRGLGELAAAAGDHRQARAMLGESLALLQAQGDPRGQVAALISFARLAAASADWPLAVRLLSAAEAQMPALGLALPPVARAALDQFTLNARQALTEEAFETAWRAGRALSLEQATALVLE